MISITTGLRKLVAIIADLKEDIEEFKRRKHPEGPAVPTQWKKDIQKIREKAPEDTSEGLKKERVHKLKQEVADKPVARPGLFIRDANRIMAYVEHEVADPTKQGFKQLLVGIINDVSAAARKGEYVFPKGKQVELLESAGKLKDSGKLLQMLADLFAETYEGVKVGGLFEPLKDMAIINRFISFYPLQDVVKKVLLKMQGKADKLTEEDLNDVKTSLKTVANAEERKMLQYLILKPLQVFFKKLVPDSKENKIREEYKDMLEKIFQKEQANEKRLKELREEIKNVITKGAPTTQVSPSTQKYERATLQSLAAILRKVSEDLG
jgi:hypothetical protein